MKNALKKIIPWVQVDKKIIRKHKISKLFFDKGLVQISKIINYQIYKKYHCSISTNAFINYTTEFPHPLGIVIGDGVTIGDNCTIYQNVTIGRKNKDIPEYPTIGNNVTIYCNSTIIGNVKIGNNAIIGCNSVVLRDVKEGETVYGIVK